MTHHPNKQGNQTTEDMDRNFAIEISMQKNTNSISYQVLSFRDSAKPWTATTCHIISLT